MTTEETAASKSKPKGWESVADLVAAKLREALDESLRDNEHLLKDIVGSIHVSGGGGGSGFGDVGSLVTFLTGIVLGVLTLNPEVGAGVAALEAAEGQAGKFGVGSALGYLMGYTAFSWLDPVFQPVQHAVANLLQTGIFDPQTAAQLQVKGIIGEQFGRSEAAGGNLAGEHYDKLVDAARARPAIGELLDLLNRGHLTGDEVVYNLTRLGYDEATITALLNLQRNLLGGADLALGLLRQDITEEQALQYAQAIGITGEDLQILYNNTGEPPGPEQLLFLWRRGFISKDRLERGIRQSRIRPEWIDAVENLRYVPMTTEEAIKGVIEHYLTESEGKAIADQNGLLPEHWEPLLLSWGRPLAHGEMGSLVHRGLASREQFDQAMRESDIKDKYIGLSFESTRHLIPDRIIIQAIKYGAMTMKEGATRLMELGYDPADVSILLKLGLHESATAQHALTQSQITTLYKDAILSRKEATTHLTALGYSKPDADYLLQTIDIQTHISEVRAETSAIRLSYLAGGVHEQKAEEELRGIGLSPDQARHSVEVWNREKHRASRTLSESQIIKAGKAGTLTFDNALNLLVTMGYARNDAAILLNSNGVAPIPPPTH